jgi:flavin reductase (DIM6/NTAB) family NADH-FMN oxidoreductase RutF
MSSAAPSKEKIGPAIGRLASGVYIVTVDVAGKKDGMLATWITQAGFEPPSLVVSVNKQRDILRAMNVGDRFTINVLSNRNMDIFKAFASRITTRNLPVLLSKISCRFSRRFNICRPGLC